MASKDIDAAEDAARLALLRAIGKKAESTALSAGQLKDLAAAFALTVGGKWGELPGGGIDVTVSK
ncbi:hypothetical protein SEA_PURGAMENSTRIS_31 [Mycobacterium phage Purgamenstris]|uniref:Uncharacterized protein n=6 Tax=Charlievirus redi TaxID=2003505 RepID=A0A1I9SCC2_9CAUD|nr:hypothetical protein CL59_gp31 [Mycobacterium phage Redi]AOZ64499.1 hypothetical protein SEA_PHANCYPHIN_31 [Mycobacterium phage PhancyPhin]QAY16013.1 hypothetical protein SEA_BABERUTH_31 [Mycobacterium phage BabeRuth]QBI99159.1 hypothetical protein SEA_NENAE_31 [Mycobacterium phage Nenae]QBI99230.1 hypothetical protein SEA_PURGAMENSTRIS_31 [Mycobacterium phage Purgamenstris]QBI99906.1 hypothetical protein SEA_SHRIMPFRIEDEGG_31 [Mycobacterium phage ShrimpFriedEgg]